MKAIILAAGKGTRLGGLTEDIPKPMLPLNGTPLLEYILRHLKANGFSEIGINLYTMPEKIEEYFASGDRLGVDINYSHEKELMGTAGSLLAFGEWLQGEENFLVVYGDIITDQDLQPLIELHNNRKAYATLLLHERKVSNSCVELNENSRVIDFHERPDQTELIELKKKYPNGFLVNSAIQVLSRKVIDYIKKEDCFDLPKDVYSKVYNKEKIFGYQLTGNRVAVDSQKRYYEAEEMLKELKYAR